MGIRSFVNVSLQAGFDNSLDDMIFSHSFQQLLDTMEHAQAAKGTLEGNGTVTVPFGDVSEARLIFIEADGDLDVEFGGSPPTSAELVAVGADYPVEMDDEEQLEFAVDGSSVTATFDEASLSVTQVANILNAAAALEGLGTVWSVTDGQLRFRSPTTGESSLVSVSAGSAATKLGFDEGASAVGQNATPNTSRTKLRRQASVEQATGLKVYSLQTVRTSSLHLTNPSSSAVRYRTLILGDLSPASC